MAGEAGTMLLPLLLLLLLGVLRSAALQSNRSKAPSLTRRCA
jgi:hypothetical protein